MFYCNNCATKNGYPESMFKTFGRCESCEQHAECNEVQSSRLPKSNHKIDPERGIIIKYPDSCPKCKGDDIQERSGYKVCFTCGEHQ